MTHRQASRVLSSLSAHDALGGDDPIPVADQGSAIGRSAALGAIERPDSEVAESRRGRRSYDNRDVSYGREESDRPRGSAVLGATGT